MTKKNKKLDYSDLLGGTFKWLAKGENNEWDCWSLTREVLRRVGKELPDKKSFIDLKLRNAAFEEGRKLVEKLEKPEPYCIVAFKTRRFFITHIAIVLEDCKTFIHIQKKTRVNICRLDHIFWENKIEGYYRVL